MTSLKQFTFSVSYLIIIISRLTQSPNQMVCKCECMSSQQGREQGPGWFRLLNSQSALRGKVTARLNNLSDLPPFAQGQSKVQLCTPSVIEKARVWRGREKVSRQKDFNIILGEIVKVTACVMTQAGTLESPDNISDNSPLSGRHKLPSEDAFDTWHAL